MARLNKIAISLCALLFTSISFTPLAHASGHTHASATPKAHQAKGTSERKKKVSTQKTKSSAKTSSKKASTSSRAKHPTRTTASSQTALNRQVAGGTKKCVLRKGYKKQCADSVKSTIEPTRAMASVKQKCVVRKGYKKRCKPVAEEEVPLTLADAHKVRVQKAQSTAMSKLMDQIGKPYRWGGTSPRTGFDCSGLVYYAYKDLVKIHIPRTANEMYHLRDARPVDRGELESGDLVFFRTRGRGTADHVGVYVGNGKFIQSPRTGRDIQITSLSEDYWVRHYVGARRVMTPKTIR